jgi:hypothetical protein
VRGVGARSAAASGAGARGGDGLGAWKGAMAHLACGIFGGNCGGGEPGQGKHLPSTESGACAVCG